MAISERDIVLVGRDKNGDECIDFPFTRLALVEDTAEIKAVPEDTDYLALTDSKKPGTMKKARIPTIKHALKLQNVDNTSDTDKPVSTLQKTALDKKADKEDFDTHTGNTVAHVTETEKKYWNDKADNEALTAHIDNTSVHITTEERTAIAELTRIINSIPLPIESLAYTGSAQSPAWNSYDSKKMALGGTTSATNAGTYSVTFTPKVGYEWFDGTTKAKTVNWSIGKAAGSITLSKTSISLTSTSPASTFTITRPGDGAISISSSNTDVVTVILSGTTATVTAHKNGSATVTVRVAAGTNHTAAESKICSVTASDMGHVYGVSWDGSSTTKWTRTDDAVGFTDPVPYVAGASAYGSPFDKLAPWNGMVKSERTGGTMVAIPKFWYRLTQNGNGMSIQIADKKRPGFSVSPAHMNRGDGKGERAVVYVGRYHCCGADYKSTSGQKPKDYITRSEARSAISAIGSNIWQYDFLMLFTIWLLYLVEFADWNSQAVIGAGCGNGRDSGTGNMGYTDSMPYHTGTTLSSRDTYGFGTQYRNIEGLWDNVWDWCDGCYSDNSGFNLIKNPGSFSDSGGGVSVGIPYHFATFTFPTKFTVAAADGVTVFYPTESTIGVKDGGTTYSCDVFKYGPEDPCLCSGGNYTLGKGNGLFCSVSIIDGTSDQTGARLQELP